MEAKQEGMQRFGTWEVMVQLVKDTTLQVTAMST